MTGSTTSRRLAAASALAFVATAAAVPAAFAGGEPKNQAPFTRIVAARGLTQGLAASRADAPLSIRGETKNQLPFTRR